MCLIKAVQSFNMSLPTYGNSTQHFAANIIAILHHRTMRRRRIAQSSFGGIGNSALSDMTTSREFCYQSSPRDQRCPACQSPGPSTSSKLPASRNHHRMLPPPDQNLARVAMTRIPQPTLAAVSSSPPGRASAIGSIPGAQGAPGTSPCPRSPRSRSLSYS